MTTCDYCGQQHLTKDLRYDGQYWICIWCDDEEGEE